MDKQIIIKQNLVVAVRLCNVRRFCFQLQIVLFFNLWVQVFFYRGETCGKVSSVMFGKLQDNNGIYCIVENEKQIYWLKQIKGRSYPYMYFASPN